MGPKKVDSSGKVSKLSLGAIALSNLMGGGTAGEPGH
jgi:hypothetical protein